MHGDFINDQLFIEELPRLENIEYQKLQSSFQYVLLFRAVFFSTLLFFAYTLFVIFTSNWSFYYLTIGYGAVFLYAIIAVILRYLGFHKKGYALRREDIVYKTGLLWRRETIIPFSRIQHCEIKQGPIDSLLDLAKLKVYTAGGSGSDLVIPGLIPDEAARLRKFIVKKTGLNEEE